MCCSSLYFIFIRKKFADEEVLIHAYTPCWLCLQKEDYSIWLSKAAATNKVGHIFLIAISLLINLSFTCLSKRKQIHYL